MTKIKMQVMIRWYAYHDKRTATLYADEINLYSHGLSAEVVEHDNELLPWAVEVYSEFEEVRS